MGEHTFALSLLQVIALTLPAIALYMTVLIEIHMAVKRKTGLQVDPDAPGLEGYGGKIDLEPDPYTVRLTTAINQYDFALALVSLGTLLISAILIIASVAVSAPFFESIGVVMLVLGFLTLFLAIIVTLSISARALREAFGGGNQ